MDNEYSNDVRRPRIVAPAITETGEDELDFLSQFKTLPTATLAEELKKKLEATEKNLWDLETAVFALEDGPEGMHGHIGPRKSDLESPGEGSGYEYNPQCPCTRCEHGRTVRQRDLMRHALARLRALYAKLMS